MINNTFLKELLQSEKVIQALKAHQKKVKENKIKEMQERKVKKEQEPLKGATGQGKKSLVPLGITVLLKFFRGETGIWDAYLLS